MASYYKLLAQPSSNTYTPLMFIEETNAGDTLLEAAGLNVMVVGLQAVGYTPATGGNSAAYISVSLLDGTILELTYANITSYDIYGVTTGLTDIHAIWDSLQTGNILAL